MGTIIHTLRYQVTQNVLFSVNGHRACMLSFNLYWWVVDWSALGVGKDILGIRQGWGEHRMVPCQVLLDRCRKHIRRSDHGSVARQSRRLLSDAVALLLCTAVGFLECRLGGMSASNFIYFFNIPTIYLVATLNTTYMSP